MQNETASKETILEIRDLKVNIKTDEGTLTAVRGVNLTIKKGETLGLVGESGCGKTTTGRTIINLYDPPRATCTSRACAFPPRRTACPC